MTPKERTFLINFPEDRRLTSNERHYVSSITQKTRKALKDLDLILEKLPYDKYLLFSEEEIPSLKNPIKEVTKILYGRNYRQEFWRMRKQKIKGKLDKKTICEKTRNQIDEIVDSVLNKLRTKL